MHLSDQGKRTFVVDSGRIQESMLKNKRWENRLLYPKGLLASRNGGVRGSLSALGDRKKKKHGGENMGYLHRLV